MEQTKPNEGGAGNSRLDLRDLPGLSGLHTEAVISLRALNENIVGFLGEILVRWGEKSARLSLVDAEVLGFRLLADVALARGGETFGNAALAKTGDGVEAALFLSLFMGGEVVCAGKDGGE